MYRLLLHTYATNEYNNTNFSIILDQLYNKYYRLIGSPRRNKYINFKNSLEKQIVVLRNDLLVLKSDTSHCIQLYNTKIFDSLQISIPATATDDKSATN